MTPQEFAQKIRTKYPGAYDNLDDITLSQKVIAKYPVYANQVNFEQPKTIQPTTGEKIIESGKELFTPTIEIGKGAVKGAGSTIFGLGKLGEKILRGTAGKVVEAIIGKPLEEPTYKEKPEILKPEGTYQKSGYIGEQIGEFFIPAGKIGQIENIIKTAGKASLLSKLIPVVGEKTALYLAKAGEIGLRSLLRGTEAGGITAIQQGEIGKESGIAMGIGAAIPPISEGIGLLKKAIPSIFEFTSGVPKKAIEKRIEDVAANKAIAPNATTVEEIRKTAIKEYKGLTKDLGDEFSQGLESIYKKAPLDIQSREAAGAIQDKFQLSNSIRNTIREFRVAITENGKTLDFDKLNSSIVKEAERKNLQAIWDTIMTQSDYSPKGVEAVAEKINALTKFGEQNTKSVIAGKMHDRYSSLIKEVYPDLGKLRDTYAKTKGVLNEIGNVIGAKADKPTAIQSSVTRLSNLFKEDKETYINAIKELSRRSGVDFLNLLSSTEFQRVMPDFVRGLGGGATLSVAASLLNPWMLILAPLFSPRGIATTIKAGTKIPALGRIVEALPSVLSSTKNGEKK